MSLRKRSVVVRIAPAGELAPGVSAIFRPDMGGREDREIAVEEVQPDASRKRRPAIVVALAVAEGRVHAGVDARVNIEQGIDMRDRHDAGIHERDAEIEDIGMRIEVIGGRVDGLGAFEGDQLTGLDVDAAREQPGRVDDAPGLDRGDLAPIIDRVIEFAEVMGVARVGAIHRLQLEAEIIVGGLRIERPLDGQEDLVEQGRLALSVNRWPKLNPSARAVRIEQNAGLDEPAIR